MDHNCTAGDDSDGWPSLFSGKGFTYGAYDAGLEPVPDDVEWEITIEME